MRKNKRVISNTGRFFCFNNTVSYTCLVFFYVCTNNIPSKTILIKLIKAFLPVKPVVDTMVNMILYILLVYLLTRYMLSILAVFRGRFDWLFFLFMWQMSPICFVYVFVLILDSDITSHRVVVGLFYHKISGSSFRKTFKVSMSLNDIIDFILNCMYVNSRKCMLLSKTNFVMMSNIMLLFLLLLFQAGDVEKIPGQSQKPTTNL
jgi:hypothetical protein